MKKFFLLIAGLALLSAIVGSVIGAQASSLTALFAKGRTTKGSGKIVSRTLAVGKFDGVSSSRAIRVEIREAKAGELLVEADDNLLDKVVAKVDATGMLTIGFDKSVGSLSDIHVTVTVPYDERIGRLKASSASRIVCKSPLKARKVSLKASSAASIEASAVTTECEVEASSAANIDGTFKTRKCSFDLSSSACINADVTTADCEADLSSASRLELTGSADRCKGNLSSAATLHAEEFTVRNADFDTSSGASARIRCTENLRAEASSGSSIRYTGECNVHAKTSSGGSVHKK